MRKEAGSQSCRLGLYSLPTGGQGFMGEGGENPFQ